MTAKKASLDRRRHLCIAQHFPLCQQAAAGTLGCVSLQSLDIYQPVPKQKFLGLRSLPLVSFFFNSSVRLPRLVSEIMLTSDARKPSHRGKKFKWGTSKCIVIGFESLLLDGGFLLSARHGIHTCNHSTWKTGGGGGGCEFEVSLSLPPKKKTLMED